ncbi:MAG: hypothetical protein ABR511_02365 [Acidimicrobiales bacterium]
MTAPRPHHQHRRVVVHRPRASLVGHVTTVEGVPTTRLARRLVDLAGAVHPARTARAVDNALAGRLVSLDELRVTTDQLAARGRPGIAVMRALLADRGPGYVATESELEDGSWPWSGPPGFPIPPGSWTPGTTRRGRAASISPTGRQPR